MEDREKFREMRIVEVKQRVQIVVVYEYLNKVRTDMPQGEAIRSEFIVNSLDRPIPVPYEQ